MKNIKEEAVVWVQLVVFISIWTFILFITNTSFRINFEAIKKFPDVVLVYSIFYLIFIKWVWRIPQLQGWLIPFPDLEGTWEGILKTTWVNPKTKKVPPPTPLIIVIRQNFNTISCVMYTKESNSFSTTANFIKDDANGIIKFSYVYSNRPEASIRDRSTVHDGATILTIITKPERRLEGEYWTNRKTTGSIKLVFKTKELLEAFPDSN